MFYRGGRLLNKAYCEDHMSLQNNVTLGLFQAKRTATVICPVLYHLSAGGGGKECWLPWGKKDCYMVATQGQIQSLGRGSSGLQAAQSA